MPRAPNAGLFYESIMRTITIIWKCTCLPSERTFEMRERENAEDVLDWMEDVKGRLSQEHGRASPFYMAQSVEYIKFEVRPGSNVGEAGGGNA